MKRRFAAMGVTVLALLVLIVVMGNVSCSLSYPVSFEIPVSLGESEFPSLGLLQPGDSIPETFNALSLPIPGVFPSRDTIDQFIQDHGFGFLLNFVHLDSVELVEMDLNATNGTFDGLTQIAFNWISAPVGGITPAPTDLGTVTSETATMGTDLVFMADPSPDLLTLMDNVADHDEGTDPELNISIAGHVPATLPTWTSTITIRISFRIGWI